MFNTLRQDLRYSLRALLAKPAFVFAAVATLALGIGANTAIFSVINGLLLKPLPYNDGERLVQVYNVYPNMGLNYAGTSIPDYLDRKAQAEGLEDLAMYTGESFNLAADGPPQRLVGLRATPSLFSTLQVQAALGRVFTEAEAEIGADKVVVLSYSAWQSQFAGDRNIVGRDVRMNGESYRVIGVMPQGFVFPNRHTQVWVPFAFKPAEREDGQRGNEYSDSIGRLKPGVSVEQLNAQLDAIIARNAERIGGMSEEGAADFAAFLRAGNFKGRAHSLRREWVGEIAPALLLLQGVVALVLLIACANVANLMLTRTVTRRRELSVRTALGAGRGRIARQLLLESILLALMGAVAGMLVAYALIELLQSLGLSQNQLSTQVGIDGSVLLFTAVLALVTGVVFGLFPVLSQSGMRVYEVLKEGGRGNSGGRAARITRNALVVAQLALAVALLIGAGLLMRSFSRIQGQDPGFERDGLITARVEIPKAKYTDASAQAQFYQRALAELRAVPGVRSAAYTSNLPFGNSNWTSSYNIVGLEQADGTPSPHGYARLVDEQFFDAMGIRVLRGRGFTVADSAQAPKVAIADDVFVKKYFPNEDPIGKRIRSGATGEDIEYEIVGIVSTVKVGKLTDEITKESIYYPFRQSGVASGFFVVKSNLPTGGLIEPIRQAVLRVDAEQPIFDVRTVDERIAISLENRRAPMMLLAIFAGVALLLAAIGIYGVLAFSVAQRTGELGVRMAIGAQSRDITRMVLRQGARVTGLGLGLGLIGAVLLSGFMQAQLFGVSRFDPLVFAAVVAVLGAVALLACYVPARRAARVSPMVALRYE
jgi:predicted permease